MSKMIFIEQNNFVGGGQIVHYDNLNVSNFINITSKTKE